MGAKLFIDMQLKLEIRTEDISVRIAKVLNVLGPLVTVGATYRICVGSGERKSALHEVN